jgi:cobalt transporter subunit CbtB
MNTRPTEIYAPNTELNAVVAKLPAIAFAAVLGAFIFFAVGFAGPAEIHNAAHDSRHVMAFPCH